MYGAFDAFEYLEYLRRRWRVTAVALSAAVLISLPASMLLPKRYTATASVVIEPPGGNDVRVGTAVSAVYLESLKTYERFAASDTLFARAVEKFHLRDAAGSQAIESLKAQRSKGREDPRDKDSGDQRHASGSQASAGSRGVSRQRDREHEPRRECRFRESFPSRGREAIGGGALASREGAEGLGHI